MVLSQNGIDYISQNFGDANLCCVKNGLSWYYTSEGVDYPETGGTAQIVFRLASGWIDSLTMTSPARGTFTKAELDAANESVVDPTTDPLEITNHDEPTEVQWCYGVVPPPQTPWWVPVIAIAGIATVAGVIVWQAK